MNRVSERVCQRAWHDSIVNQRKMVTLKLSENTVWKQQQKGGGKDKIKKDNSEHDPQNYLTRYEPVHRRRTLILRMYGKLQNKKCIDLTCKHPKGVFFCGCLLPLSIW